MIRTIPWRSVTDGIYRRRGVDSHGDDINTDTGLTLTDRANARVRKAWFLWEWPEWTVTEERAFRQVWNDSRQFYIVGPKGTPDEVFYIPNIATHSLDGAGYFRVRADAPGDPAIGNPPTDTAYWEAMSSVDTYIEFDQVCRRRIGEVLEIFADNPAAVKCPRTLAHEPSENGIKVYDACGFLTVFVRYLTPVEKFTTMPYIPTRTYLRGDVVYVDEVGECFMALQVALNQDPVTATAYWRQCLFPEVLSEYVILGTVADTQRDAGGQDPGAEAEDELNRQINRLQAEGQHYQYLPFGAVIPGMPRELGSYPGYVLQGGGPDYGPVAITGTGTTTLSDACESAWGYIPPAPVPVTVPTMDWAPTIKSLAGPEQPALNAVPTGRLPLNEGRQISLMVGGSFQEQTWQLQTGSADPDDPGHVQPLDHDDARNNVFWYRIG